MAFKRVGGRYPGVHVSNLRWISRTELARKCATFGPCPDAIHEACGEDGAGGSGLILVNHDRESSFVMSGLPVGPSGVGAVNTVAASGDPSFAGQTLPLKTCTF